MTSDGRTAENALSTTADCWAGPDSRFLPGDKLAPPFGKELCSRELIARQRALVRDIKDVISLTRKIIATTREQLDAFNFPNGDSRAPAGHSDSASEASPEARRS